MEGETRRLVTVWAMMMALTLLALAIGPADAAARLPKWVILVLLGLSLAKATLLLRHYLELRRAPSWNGGLLSLIGLTLALIAGLAMIT